MGLPVAAVNRVRRPGWAYRGEAFTAALLLAGLLALKVAAASRYRFNSDEPQHLHVIWGWTLGLVQYRDLFDNHPPLFHLLMAPLFRLFPERADIVVPMRLLMLPFYLAALAALFRIGRSLYSPRAGVWLALIAGALPWFFFPGTEVRPDDLFAAILIFALAVTIDPPFTRTRAGAIGLLLGLCAALTLKTALAGISLALAGGIALSLRWRFARWRLPAREVLLRACLCGVAGLIVPGLVCLYFADQDALPALYYCVFRHNIVPHAERWSGSPLHYACLPAALPLLIGAAAWVYRKSPGPEIGARRVTVFLFPLFYGLLLYGYWPDITPQDTLPYVPLLPCAAMPLVAAWASRVARKPGALTKWLSYLLPPAAVLFFILLIFRTQEIKGSVQKYISPIEAVLHLTEPGEMVMDLKGDAIYRPRPFYYIIETFTNVRLKLGWIRNDIVRNLITTRTAVCFHPPFPGAGVMDFIDHNYVTLASQPRVMVLGQKLRSDPGPAPRDFQLVIPGGYVIVRDGSLAKGILDGTAYDGARTLAAGPHRFVPAEGTGPMTLFWARAWEKGFRPAP